MLPSRRGLPCFVVEGESPETTPVHVDAGIQYLFAAYDVSRDW